MKIIGHRGARGLAPENTLAAIKAGLAAGADMLEIDVRVTKDGVPILYHDRYLGNLSVSDHTLKELRAKKPDVTTLEQALTAINRQIPVIIEIKPHVPTKPIVLLVKKFLQKNWQPKDFFVASFDYQILKAIRSELPDISLVVLERWSGVRATWRARRLHTKFVCMKHLFLWWGFVASMARSGYSLSSYTLNNPAKAKRWAARGLYGVVTDFPDRYRVK